MRPFLLASLVAVLLVGCARPDYDVVIENGRVVDGTGNPWMYADVGIKGDRIATIAPRGALHDKSARQRIDARGHVVAPGFIDIQNHSWDNVLWKDGRIPSMVTQGVTSSRSWKRSRRWNRLAPSSNAPSAASTGSADGSTRSGVIPTR